MKEKSTNFKQTANKCDQILTNIIYYYNIYIKYILRKLKKNLIVFSYK